MIALIQWFGNLFTGWPDDRVSPETLIRYLDQEQEEPTTTPWKAVKKGESAHHAYRRPYDGQTTH